MAGLSGRRWLGSLKAAAAAYTDNQWRRAWIARSSLEDTLAGTAMAVLWFGMAAKTWRVGEPGMAVLPASYAAHVALQVALLPRVRAARAPWRELCYLASCQHMVVANLVLTLWSRASVLAMHGGSALWLAAMLSSANCSLIQMFLWPISGIQLPFVAAALPLVMALPLASSRRLCLRLLEEDTAAEPLVLLHSLIGAAHSPFAGPYAWQLRAERPNPPSDPSRRLQQCLEVNLYLFFTLGCALPLLYAWRMQGRRQRGAATEEATAEEAAGLPWRQVHPLPCLLLASCAAWCVSGVAGLAFH